MRMRGQFRGWRVTGQNEKENEKEKENENV